MTHVNGAARPHYGQKSQHATGGKKGSGSRPVDGWAQAGHAKTSGAASGADLLRPTRGHHHVPGDHGGPNGTPGYNPPKHHGPTKHGAHHPAPAA